jgi:hypothetical protein
MVFVGVVIVTVIGAHYSGNYNNKRLMLLELLAIMKHKGR